MTTKSRTRMSRGAGGRGRRPVLWENTSVSHNHPAASALIVTDVSPEAIQTGTEQTGLLRRTILHFTMSPTVAASAFDIAIGIAVVTEDGLAAGALPDPLAALEQGWLYWTERFFIMQNGSPTQLDWDVEINSMRKLRGGYRLALISETPITDDANDLHITARLLWSVP